jgi:hypothetical protein
MCVCARHWRKWLKRGRLRTELSSPHNSSEYVRHQSIGAYTHFCVCVCAGRVDLY